MWKIPEISCNKKGTHSLQTFVSLISMEKEINLMVNAIKNDVLRLSKVKLEFYCRKKHKKNLKNKKGP